MNKILTLKDIEQILYNRIKNNNFKTLKSLPQPKEFKDITKATNRIVKAIKDNETINIVGDYDVDGVVSTAIMVEFFRHLNIKVNYTIPNRFKHGYGLSPIILEDINSGIIITVDNGISAIEAANICKDRGLDLIITDHHTVGDTLPKAYAIVNPKQEDCNFPFKEICGAQVAWYLCASIKQSLQIDYNLINFFDILALAIVADIMPMIGLNQTMVRYGLDSLKKSNRPAIVALRDRYSLTNITEEDIGFKFAPLINCAGRMSDPSIALDFLLSTNEYEANNHLDTLIELNEKRKNEQLQIFNEAKTQVDTNDKVIVVSSPSWNEGIIGIVASKLCEKYKKPSFVFTINDTIAKASARSTSSVHLYNLIEKSKDILIGFGGHKQAAGLNLHTANLSSLKMALNNHIDTLPEEEEDKSSYSIGVLSLDILGEEIFNLIESFRPFGQDNPYPLFTFKNLKVLNITKMGRNKEFTKFIISNGFINCELISFIDIDNNIKVDDNISFIASISKNEFRGNISYNLLLKEILDS